MNRNRTIGRGLVLAALALGLACASRGSASDEIARLAALLDWKEGTVVADIGAGDGSYTFEAARRVGTSGRVFATEIDKDKIAGLRAEAGKRKLLNVVVVESADSDTNLPPECCDAIFLRRVYHHLTRPVEFDAKLAGSLKPGGRLAIIDFAPRKGLPAVEGVPADRGGHGIPQPVVVRELTAAGLQLVKTENDWPDNGYCLVFAKK